MERHKKRFGVRMDKDERDRKREARRVHKVSEFAQKSFGLRAKLFNQKRFKEKAAMRKTIAQHQEGSNKHSSEENVTDGAVPAYLLDREETSRAKILSNTVKQKRKEKAGACMLLCVFGETWTSLVPCCPAGLTYDYITCVSRQVDCAHPKGEASGRRRDVQTDLLRQEAQEPLEAHDHQGILRSRY